MPKTKRRRNFKTIPLLPYPGRSSISDMICWESAPPFVMSKAGVILHRVRHVQTYFATYGQRHTNSTYWCGNSTNSPLFVERPGELLLCERCEMLAQKAGMRSAETIAGQHVHIGVLRPVRLC